MTDSHLAEQRLAAALTRPTPWLTGSDLAKVYGVTLRTIRRWAAEDHWRTPSGRYSLYDADKSYRKRHGDRVTALLAQRLDKMAP
jgi:uncharacterized protein YjcR